MSVVHKFGRNDVVGNGTWEDVWTRGGAYVWPQTAGPVHLFSDSTADTSTGAGARSVTIEGLSTGWEPLTETVVTSGTSTSVSSNSFIRVNRAYVATAGAYGGLFIGGNRGTLMVDTTGGDAVADILTSTGGGTVAFGQTQISRYTVQKDYVAFIQSIHLSVDSAQSATVALFQRQNADVIVAPMSSPRILLEFDAVTGEETFNPESPLGPFPGHTDLWWAAKGDAGVTEVDVDYELHFFREGTEPEHWKAI